MAVMKGAWSQGMRIGVSVRIGPPWIVLGLYAERLRTATAITEITPELMIVKASRLSSRAVRLEEKVEARSSAHPMRTKGSTDRNTVKNDVFTLMGALR